MAAICGTGLKGPKAPCPKFTAMLANPPISVANPPRNAPKIRPIMSDIIVPALIALDSAPITGKRGMCEVAAYRAAKQTINAISLDESFLI